MIISYTNNIPTKCFNFQKMLLFQGDAKSKSNYRDFSYSNEAKDHLYKVVKNVINICLLLFA